MGNDGSGSSGSSSSGGGVEVETEAGPGWEAGTLVWLDSETGPKTRDEKGGGCDEARLDDDASR